MYLNIIDGFLKSRKVFYFRNMKILRPTMLHVRKMIFEWFDIKINEAIILDAFAGSGILSFEAISRGAKKVFILEKNIVNYNNILLNKNKFCINNCYVFHVDCILWLKKYNNLKFDLILLDPPFCYKYLDLCFFYIIKKNILKKGGFLYLETTLKLDDFNIPLTFFLLKKKKINLMYCYLFENIK